MKLTPTLVSRACARLFPARLLPSRLAAVTLAAFGWLATAPLGVSATQPETPIDINSASVEELIELPRVGKVTAERIVAWREENGPFTRPEELLNVEGIGERTFELIEPHVTVGDSPGAPPPDPDALGLDALSPDALGPDALGPDALGLDAFGSDFLDPAPLAADPRNLNAPGTA